MKLAITALVILMSLPYARGSYVDLTSFGSTDFTVDGSATTATYTQSASSLNFSGTIVLADTLGGIWNAAPFDWSAYDPSTDFAAKFTVVGTNPSLPFTLTLFDSSFTLVNFSGTTVGATTDTYIPLTLTDAPSPAITAALGAIAGAQFTWDGGASGSNVTLQSVAAVPEPSTYALLAMSGFALGGYVMRRRRRA